MGERITPERVVEAFKKTGMKPVRGEHYHEGTCCGLTAVLDAEKPNEFQSILENPYCMFSEHREYALMLDDRYAKRFMNGWDGELLDDDEGNSRGYVDGKLAWRAVADAGLLEDDEYDDA